MSTLAAASVILGRLKYTNLGLKSSLVKCSTLNKLHKVTSNLTLCEYRSQMFNVFLTNTIGTILCMHPRIVCFYTYCASCTLHFVANSRSLNMALFDTLFLFY